MAITALIGTILSAILTGLQFVGHAVTAALVALSTWILAALQYVGLWVKDFALASWGAIKGIYTHVLKPLAGKVEDLFGWARRTYQRFIRPVLDWMERVQATIDKIYRRFFRPILATLSALRALLAITRLNQTAWGRRLDDSLAGLEARLASVFVYIQRVVNESISRVMLRIEEIDRLLSAPEIARRLLADTRGLITAWWRDQIQPLTPEGRRRLATLKARKPLDEDRTALVTYLTRQRGDYLGQIVALSALTRQVAEGGRRPPVERTDG